MKKNMLALSALVLAIGLSAFSVNKRKSGNFYLYTGGQTSTERKNPLNYYLYPDDPGCSGTTSMCALYLNQTTTQPVFSNGNVIFNVYGYPETGSTFLSPEYLQ